MKYFRTLSIPWAVEYGSTYHRVWDLVELVRYIGEFPAMLVFDKNGNAVTTNERGNSPAVTPVPRELGSYWVPYGQTPRPIPSPIADEYQDLMNETPGPGPKIVQMLRRLQYQWSPFFE